MSDIVERIKSLRYIHVPQASQLFEEACEAIESLRLEVARLRLTDEEREAIHWVIGDVADITGPVEATLRGLLDRTK